MSLKPAANLQASAVAAAIVTAGQAILAKHGYALPPDVANAFTALVTVAVAHLWDVLTGENEPEAK